jgi:nucleoside-diphosphate-sugar epimerase
MKKILIIGGLGYIGSVLKLECEKEGFEPVVIDNNLYGLASCKESFIHCDILNKDSLNIILKNLRAEADCIINLAAVVGDPACLVNTKEALEINCIGTRNIVELANEYKYKIIHASTCSLYGSEKKSTESPLHEDSFVFPVDFYGQTKYQQERFVKELCHDFCIFRLGTAYRLSPRMRYDLVVNLFSAINSNHFVISNFGTK